MEQPVTETMLTKPKTAWVCNCGVAAFHILLCPECEGEDAHIIGFQCVECEVIHLTLSADPAIFVENEDVIH